MHVNPKLVDADKRHRAKETNFSLREFGRILTFVWPFRKKLVMGLIATVIFAALHTVSIVAALPILHILLEKEDLHVFLDRTIAGARLGVKFAPLDSADDASVVVVDLPKDGTAFARGLRKGDRLEDPSGGSAAAMLAEIAHRGDVGEGTDSIEVRRLPASGQTDGAESSTVPYGISLHIEPPDTLMRVERWIGSLIPESTASDKLAILIYILGGVVTIVVIANGFRYFGEVTIAGVVLRSMIDLRSRLYERTLHLPMSFYAGQPTADLVTRFVQDIQEVQRGMMTLFGKFFREPLRAAFMLGIAFMLDWRITITVVFVVPVVVFAFLTIGRRVKKSNRKLLQAYGMMIGALTTSLQSLRVVKAYTAEDIERQRLNRVDWKMFRQQMKLAKLQAFTSPLMETLAVIAGSVGMVWLAGRVLSQDLDPAKFGTLGMALSMLFDPLRKLSDVYVRLQRSTAGAERIFQVIDEPVESDLSDATTELAPLGDAIEYAGVTYTYPNADTPALVDVNMTIRRGETVAIVGPNGCGKTTLVSMLPRMFDPDQGEVRYDGLDIRLATLGSLRRQVSVVSQEAVIFAGTPIENIAFGDATPDVDRVKDAAARAFAEEFILAIPGGYEADLGERGTTLSGGQRQRLAIARAIYRDAPILIFDEATSQIDTESEQKIQAALEEFARGRTTLIIAHRLSTIRFAERIIVMDAGRVLDSGSHDQLYERCTLYRKLCDTQFMDRGAAT